MWYRLKGFSLFLQHVKVAHGGSSVSVVQEFYTFLLKASSFYNAAPFLIIYRTAELFHTTEKTEIPLLENNELISRSVLKFGVFQ